MNLWVDANGWPVPPTLLLGCIIAEILYLRGWRVLIKEAQAKEIAKAMLPSAGEFQRNAWLWHGVFFICAIFVFLAAASTPIDTLSSRFFLVHMVQHLLLLVVMAPLLVAGAPLRPLWLGLPDWTRRLIKTSAKLKVGHAFYRMGHWLIQPSVSCGLLIIGIWVWHWPALYDFALTNEVIHDWGEHLTFLAVSILFWAQVIPSPPFHPRLGYLGRLGCIGVAIAQNLVLAVLIGFAQIPLYIPYAHLAQGFGSLSALQDQQIGASIMWTIGDLPFGIALSILVQKWLASQSDDATIAVKS